MKVGHVTESGVPMGIGGPMDGDDDRAGYDLGATGRLALMAKLAEGTGLKVNILMLIFLYKRITGCHSLGVCPSPMGEL